MRRPFAAFGPGIVGLPKRQWTAAVQDAGARFVCTLTGVRHSNPFTAGKLRGGRLGHLPAAGVGPLRLAFGTIVLRRGMGDCYSGNSRANVSSESGSKPNRATISSGT